MFVDLQIITNQEKHSEICKIFIDHSSIVFFSWKPDREWSVNYVSENIRHFGYTPDEFLRGGKKYVHIIYHEDVNRVVHEANVHADNGTNSFNQVYRIVTADNGVCWIENHTDIVRDEEGKIIYFLGTIIDITERKTLEQKLIESEEKFRSIAESTMVGFFIYQEKFVYVNQAISDLSGYTQEELYNMKVWDFADESYKNSLKEIVLKRCNGEQFVNKFDDLKLVTKNGQIKTVRTMANTIPYKGGWAGAGTIVDITDITDVKKQINLLAHAVEQTDDMVRITDREGIIIFVNDATLRHSGYNLNDIIGQTPRIFKSGKHDNIFYTNLWETIKAGKTYRGVFQNIKKDGTLYHEEETITPIMDKENHIQYYVVTGKDISERIALEKELHYQATTDQLTGAYNRKKFIGQLESELDRFRRYNNIFSVLMIDVDHFKNVNDNYGHDIGDNILKKMCHVMSTNIRKIDMLARWGGEEFMIICPELTKENAIVFAEKLREVIESFTFDDIGHISVSIGITSSKAEDTLDMILKRADIALYHSKNNGRNQIYYI